VGQRGKGCLYGAAVRKTEVKSSPRRVSPSTA